MRDWSDFTAQDPITEARTHQRRLRDRDGYSDRSFDTSQLHFPDEVPLKVHPFWGVQFEGDVPTVNGAPWPYLNIEPRRYRFRILNGSNHRFYKLQFGKAPVYAIGADDNYLDNPLKESSVSVTPGERVDIVVDFTGLKGQTITMSNSGMSESVSLPEIMQFRVVTALKGRDQSCDPAGGKAPCARPLTMVRLTDGRGNLAPGVKIDKVRQIVLDEEFDLPTTIQESLNNTKWDGLHSPSIAAQFPKDGISELPRIGSTELWEIINIFDPGSEMQSHPIHTHLTKFQILNRQRINMDKGTDYLAAWDAAFGTGPVPLPPSCTAHQFCPDYGPPLPYLKLNADGALGGNPALRPFLQGSPTAPDVGESGWKDTAVSYGHQVLRLVIRWTPSDIRVMADRATRVKICSPSIPRWGPTSGIATSSIMKTTR